MKVMRVQKQTVLRWYGTPVDIYGDKRKYFHLSRILKCYNILQKANLYIPPKKIGKVKIMKFPAGFELTTYKRLTHCATLVW